MGINGQSNTTTKLDIDLFQSIFEKSNPGVVIDSLEVHNGTSVLFIFFSILLDRYTFKDCGRNC